MSSHIDDSMIRLFLHSLSAVLITLWALTAGAHARDNVSLEIVNGNRAAEIRCVVLLAHFFSLELGRIVPGGVLSVGLQRDAESSTLILTNAAGEAMAVENLICGSAANWSESRNEVALQALRSGEVTVARIACDGEDALRCTPLD